MTEEDRPRFARALMTLAEVYAESLSEFRMEAYFTILKDYSIEAVERAITQAMRQTKFFPKPAELGDLLALPLANRALLAWHIALDARNANISVRFEDPIINEVIRRMGGWPEFCGLDGESRPFRQKEFERLYLVLAVLPELDCANYLAGMHEQTHPGEYGRVAQPGSDLVDGKVVRKYIPLDSPRMVQCTYLANENTLAACPTKALQRGEDESGNDA